MKRYLAALASLVMGLAICLTAVVFTAAPANATISFCQTAKNSPCISPINGCAAVLGGGKYVFAENGDSIIDVNGSRMLCVNGRWIRTAALGVEEVEIGGTAGRGLLTQGAPAPGSGCNPEEVFCPFP